MGDNGEAPTACNTKAVGNNIRKRAWMLTINNPEESDIDSINKQYELDGTIDLIGQHEIGENDTEHIQLFINWKNAKTFNQVKKLFPRAHIEPANDIIKSAKYCMKENTRITDKEPWIKIGTSKIDKAINQVDTETQTQDPFLIAEDCVSPMENKTWYKWQLELINILEEEPDDRKIHWYFDPKGGKGKTTFCKHLILERNDTILCTGSTRDSKYIVSQWMESTNCIKSPKIIIYDIARSQDSEKVSYQTIEDMKNGIFLSTKYECKTVVYNNPHMIIFSNQLPIPGKLSEDRIILHNLSDE